MKRSLVRRAAALFILSILLAAPWSAAEPRQDHRAGSPLLGRIWSRLTVLWSDIGCIIDPNGACHGSAATQGDIGCGIDPDGRCHGSAATQGDIGCIADPNGGCGH